MTSERLENLGRKNIQKVRDMDTNYPFIQVSVYYIPKILLGRGKMKKKKNYTYSL